MRTTQKRLRKSVGLSLTLLLALVVALVSCRPQPPATAFPAPQLFIQPRDGREPILRLLERAEHSVDLTVYLLTDEETIAALKRTARRGVQVRVLLEGEPYGGGESNRRAANTLRQAGVKVRFTSRAFRYTHQKSLLVDGRVGVIMTMNLTYSSFTRNREYGVITYDPSAVAEMRSVFDADWEHLAPDLPAQPYLVWSPVNARATILALIAAARERLDLEEQDLIDREVVDALVRAARRGVQVRLIRPTPRDSEKDEAANVRRLLRAGARVRYMDSPHVHAKVIVVDGKKALIGSMNLTTTSLDFNRELGIVVDAPTVLEPLLRQIERDWDRGKAARR